MRTFLRHLVVVVPLVLIVVLGLSPAWGQFKINTFDRTLADSTFSVVYNVTANGSDPKPYHIMTNDATQKHEGAASLKNVWRVHTTESWGGLNMLSYTLPTQTDSSFRGKQLRALYGDSSYIDWSAGTNLTLWYNNTKPSTAPGNGVQMRFHIYEAGGNSTYYQGSSSNYEDWYYQSAAPLNDTVPGWKQLIIPLKDNGTTAPDDKGFTLPGWSGVANNSKLDLDKIIGWTIEWTAGKCPGDTANGIVFYDDLRLGGIGQVAGAAPLYNFNNFTRDTANFSQGWNNGGLSGYTFSEEKSDTLMGPTNLGVDWAVNVKESWGGGANREFDLPAGTYFPDLSSKSELQLFIKVVKPTASTLPNDSINNKLTMRFVLFDYSDGQKEEWYTRPDVRLDSVGLKRGWQIIRMPLVAAPGDWGALDGNHFNTPNGTKDGILAWDKVGGFKIEVSSSRDGNEPFSNSLVYSGKFLLSAVVPAGFRETDKTPPAPVASVQATKATFSNVISWADVPNEPGSSYNVYVSDKTFSTTDAPGVENVPPFGLPLGTQLQTHNLIAANTDQDLSLYYGVTATDKAGNTNQPTVIGPITNKAKGVPTISLTPPANFKADGDLSEWSGIKPIHLSAFGANPTAYIVTNTKIDNDADLSADVYLACDKTNLYVAFDVTDDIISIDTSAAASSWLQDSQDMFIGLYDWRGKHHAGYLHGKTPDYHLRFALNRIIIDNDGGVSLLTPGPNYIFSLKTLTSGYTIEAKIPWTQFHAMVASDSTFSPVEGMRIPIDFEGNDNDTPGDRTARQGQLDYSVLANGNSYADVWRWTYTWIGNKMSTLGVAEQQGVPMEYALLQNYPNPFNPSTIIKYSLAKAGPVSVKVYDVLGREVATLVNDVQTAGFHQVTFNSNVLRGGLSSGVYFYKVESGSFRDIKKMMLLK